MERTDSLKSLFIEAVQSLKGSARQLFMARIIKDLKAGNHGAQHANSGGVR